MYFLVDVFVMYGILVIAQLRLCGETSCLSIQSVANMGIPLEAGFTPLDSPIPETCLLLRVSEPLVSQGTNIDFNVFV